MLCNLGTALIFNEEPAAAIPILADAVEKSRLLQASDPHEFRFLPRALHTLASALYVVGSWESALPASEESERIYKQLASADAATYTERWHGARDLLVRILDALGKQEEAAAMRSAELS
jgi:hypothetical protein